MEEYPRMVVLTDESLKKILLDKEDLVLLGRELSEEIDAKEREMKKIDEEIQVGEKSVNMDDIIARAKEVTDSFNEVVQKMDTIKREMFDRAKSGVRPELYDKYESVKKVKEDLETKRNKIGLKIQQKNDKIIPLGRRAMKRYLKNEFEDYDTLRVENDEVVGTIFNHLEDFKGKFLQKIKAN